MSFVQHHALIVTSWDIDALGEAHAKASQLFAKAYEGEDLPIPVSEIMTSQLNGICTFVVFPDGSNEYKSPSDESDAARADLIQWMEDRADYSGPNGALPLDYAEVRFGGDDPYDARLLDHNNRAVNG